MVKSIKLWVKGEATESLTTDRNTCFRTLVIPYTIESPYKFVERNSRTDGGRRVKAEEKRVIYRKDHFLHFYGGGEG